MIPVHVPIMVQEILSFFSLKAHFNAADLTAGEGGHSSFMAPLIPQGTLLCLDRDAEILALAKERLAEFPNIIYANDTYANIASVCEGLKLPPFDAILVDMGISMYHFKEAKRGFSFSDASLDMRLDESSESAEDILNRYSEKDLADIFFYYGEESQSRRLAKAVVQNRPIGSAKELAEIAFKSLGPRGKTHPATKIFQALRIYINKELEIAEKFLEEVVLHLAPGGVLCILSFHSMEDRLVKNAFKNYVSQGLGELLTPKPLEPSREEQRSNPASRSAKLRVFQRSQ